MSSFQSLLRVSFGRNVGVEKAERFERVNRVERVNCFDPIKRVLCVAMTATTTDKLASTSEVASALGVSPATVRRYIKEGFLPEPGWVNKGRRRERGYNPEWVEAALRKLRSEDQA